MNNSAIESHSNQVHIHKPSRVRRFSASTILILVAVALAAAGVVAFLIFAKRVKSAIEPELFSVSYQFLLIAVIGGAISLLYKHFSTEQDRDRDRRTILRQMHSELLDAFNTAKGVRRRIRARIGYSSNREVLGERNITACDYREQMEILIGAQLKFEVYAKRANERDLYFAQGERLNCECQKIEDYLRRIIKEYEINFATFAEPSSGRRLADLPKLAEFIGPLQEGGEFDKDFKLACRAVLSGLSTASLT